MIDRKIGPIKIKTGTDSERLTKIFESGELVYSTDKNGIYVGDDSTFGGISITNKNYTLSSTISSVPSYAKDGDIIYSNNNTYMVAQSAGSLKLFQIGNNFDYNTITSLSVQQNSISAANLSWNSVKSNGGIGLDSLSGLYIKYDPSKFTIFNGYLKALPFNNGSLYTFNTLNGAIQISTLNQVSIDIDNTTIKLSGNKLTFDASAISATDYVNSTIFSTYTAAQVKTHTFVSFDPTFVGYYTPTSEFAIKFTYNSNIFNIICSGPIDPNFVGSVFRIPIIRNQIMSPTYNVYSFAMKVLSVIDTNAYGIMYGGNSPYGVTFRGTGDTSGLSLFFEPKILNSQNVKYINTSSLDNPYDVIQVTNPNDFRIIFENNYLDYNYSACFSVRGLYNSAQNEYGTQTTAHIHSTELPTVSTLRIQTGYQYDTNNTWVPNGANKVDVEIYGNPNL